MAINPARAARLAKQTATLAVKYGPQAKLAWDNGGRQAAGRAADTVMLRQARRRAYAEAEGLKDGSVLRIAPGGETTYVVFAGEQPVASHPQREAPLTELVAHADLDRRTTPDEERARRAARRARLRPGRGTAASRREGRPDDVDPPGLPPPAS